MRRVEVSVSNSSAAVELASNRSRFATAPEFDDELPREEEPRSRSLKERYRLEPVVVVVVAGPRLRFFLAASSSSSPS